MYDAAPAAPRRLAFLLTTGGGVLCICLAAALWCAVLRCAIGRIQRAVLRSSWWPAGRAAHCLDSTWHHPVGLASTFNAYTFRANLLA